MAVEPQLSDAAIASLMEIPHPSKEIRRDEGLPGLPGRAGRDLPGHRPRVLGELRRGPAGDPRAARGLRVGHPLDMQDAMIVYSRKGGIINTSWMF